jgi:hypothetical protein
MRVNWIYRPTIFGYTCLWLNQSCSSHLQIFLLAFLIFTLAILHVKFAKFDVVGAGGLEPPTSASRTLRASQLRYAPTTTQLKEGIKKPD